MFLRMMTTLSHAIQIVVYIECYYDVCTFGMYYNINLVKPPNAVQ